MKELQIHLTQSELWGEFKSKFGTQAIRVGDIQFTKHKIPFIPYYVGYAPRVNFSIQKFSWKELKSVAKREKIILIRFDVPNITSDEAKKGKIVSLLKEVKAHCKKSSKSTFAPWNVLLDISKPDEELIASFSQKTRYNIRLASRKGAVVKEESDNKGFETFYKLLEQTSKRQKYFIHPKKYYKDLFEIYSKKDMAHILICRYKNEPLVAWMLFNYQKTLYYPYGGSSDEHRNVMGSNLIAWEAIRLGKALNCEIFDMWGATNDKNDPWWGFTRFKIGYGGELVHYIDSYDFVINKPLNLIFNTSYTFFWKIIGLLRKIH